eukprot:c11332_g1_i1.p1 GENE.c11332_g1_i1~~c11332_g1_i1.p1  ORF type:complete len:599 (+),score=140.41 c11332_g1_i1:242-1798(+)
MELLQASKEIQLRKVMIESNFESAKRAKTLAVPTTDADVKAKLRSLHHPITLFGEGPGERRERLRNILLELEQSGVDIDIVAGRSMLSVDQVLSKDAPKEVFYTEGVPKLKRIRMEIAQYSLNRAKRRLDEQFAKAQVIAELYRGQYATWEEDRKEDLKKFRFYSNLSSNIGDDRPLTSTRMNKAGDMVATTSWSGTCRLWELPSAKPLMTLEGHTERTVSVDFHPGCNAGLDPGGANVVTASADGTAKLWAINGTQGPLVTLTGHTDRLSHARFHPAGRVVATSSFDTTWRLWDLASNGQCVMEQEGHALAAYGIAFHPDGSLLGTCGVDQIVRLWDLRTGKGIQILEGHAQQVLALDFSPNGYMIATGSSDNTVKIWDLRRKKCVYTIAAHSHLVSSVRFEQTTGWYLATASYDRTVKIFSDDTYTLLKTFVGHTNKITEVDISKEGTYIVSSSFDRTFKIWSYDPLEKQRIDQGLLLPKGDGSGGVKHEIKEEDMKHEVKEENDAPKSDEMMDMS